MKTASLLLAGSALMFAVVGIAQEATTVGALIAKGGKILSKDEVMSTMAGATISGTQPTTGIQYQNRWLANGRVVGGIVSGTWGVEDDGRVVQELQSTRGRWRSVLYVIRVGNDFYTTQAPAPETTVTPVHVDR